MMQVAGYIMEGDPLLPRLDGPGGYKFVDWGQQADGAYLMPSFQSSENEEHERCFGIQRDEPCGCRKMSIRGYHVLKKDTETREVLKYGHTWRVHQMETCGKHKCEPKFPEEPQSKG